MKFVWKGYLLAVIVIALDLWTKHLAEAQLIYATPVRVTSWFDLTLLYNKGAAFSFLSDAGGWQRWFFVGVSALACIVLPVWMVKLPKEERSSQWPLGLILGGAAGNLHDRAKTGEVVDFISWHWDSYYWPAFNLADSAICVGVALLLLQGLLQWRAEQKLSS